MLIQIHMLQNYSPANLNRDDTGSPKDAIFGGFRRGRISSQCFKRSIRRSEVFSRAFKGNGQLGVRTRLLPEMVAEALEKMEVEQEIKEAILKRVPEIGRESSKEKAGGEESTNESAKPSNGAEAATKQLIFIDPAEVPPLAEKLVEIYKQLGPKKWASEKMKDITRHLSASLPRSVDIAMFGRMTTSDAFEDVQAAVQVAHPISANALSQEFDYYTAVDDLSGESGAGMIGDVEYNSSTYYKYLNVHWEELVKNLGGDRETACRGILALLEAAATAHPSGKQNSFAAFNLPDLVLVEVSPTNLAVSYANAFLKPARGSSNLSLVEDSVQKLADYIAQVDKIFEPKIQRAFVCMTDLAFPAENQVSLSGLQRWLETQLPEG
jgi:CRISPR system Cascade subunit CasC